MYNQFSINQSQKLLQNKPDGSHANDHARILAKNLIRSFAMDLKIFANFKPGKIADICNKRADDLLNFLKENK